MTKEPKVKNSFDLRKSLDARLRDRAARLDRSLSYTANELLALGFERLDERDRSARAAGEDKVHRPRDRTEVTR